MLFTVDVGNSNIVAGLWQSDELVQTRRVHTVSRKTEDEYATIFRALFSDAGYDPKAVRACCLSSVVPALSDAMAAMLRGLCGRDPVVLGPAIYPELPVDVVNPHEVGADLVADAVAARDLCAGACIVVDFGTALTFTAVSAGGRMEGVAIAPGLGTAVNSLSRDTAQLPHVRLAAPAEPFGRNTIEAIQAGIVHGYTGLVEHLVTRIKDSLGGEAFVVATGGLSGVIAPLTKVFDAVDINLTLRGLKLIANRFS